jgi:hypothetical protein
MKGERMYERIGEDKVCKVSLFLSKFLIWSFCHLLLNAFGVLPHGGYFDFIMRIMFRQRLTVRCVSSWSDYVWLSPHKPTLGSGIYKPTGCCTGRNASFHLLPESLASMPDWSVVWNCGRICTQPTDYTVLQWHNLANRKKRSWSSFKWSTICCFFREIPASDGVSLYQDQGAEVRTTARVS